MAPSQLTNTGHARPCAPGSGLTFNVEFTRMHVSRLTGQAPWSTSVKKRSVPVSTRGRTEDVWGLSHAPEKKCSTHFCIRIYYLKGSLKIKIMYSIMSFFFASLNKTILRKRGCVVPGAGVSSSPRGFHNVRLGWVQNTRGRSASFRHGLRGRKMTTGLFLLGLKCAGDITNVIGLDTDYV